MYYTFEGEKSHTLSIGNIYWDLTMCQALHQVEILKYVQKAESVTLAQSKVSGSYWHSTVKTAL